MLRCENCQQALPASVESFSIARHTGSQVPIGKRCASCGFLTVTYKHLRILLGLCACRQAEKEDYVEDTPTPGPVKRNRRRKRKAVNPATGPEDAKDGAENSAGPSVKRRRTTTRSDQVEPVTYECTKGCSSGSNFTSVHLERLRTACAAARDKASPPDRMMALQNLADSLFTSEWHVQDALTRMVCYAETAVASSEPSSCIVASASVKATMNFQRLALPFMKGLELINAVLADSYRQLLSDYPNSDDTLPPTDYQSTSAFQPLNVDHLIKELHMKAIEGDLPRFPVPKSNLPLLDRVHLLYKLYYSITGLLQIH
ncbi:hypothetical protein DFS34DRAFT_620160 [Phlyctochytrium arcticum]|nr:hypothetical protein DFS34DRAFT_620160 [Phlyctochytrium arcticum]